MSNYRYFTIEPNNNPENDKHATHLHPKKKEMAKKVYSTLNVPVTNYLHPVTKPGHIYGFVDPNNEAYTTYNKCIEETLHFAFNKLSKDQDEDNKWFEFEINEYEEKYVRVDISRECAGYQVYCGSEIMWDDESACYIHYWDANEPRNERNEYTQNEIEAWIQQIMTNGRNIKKKILTKNLKFKGKKCEDKYIFESFDNNNCYEYHIKRDGKIRFALTEIDPTKYKGKKKTFTYGNKKLK